MNVGDMVRASYMTSGFHRLKASEVFTGIVTSIEKQKSLFSDKYSIIEIETIVEVLCEGKLKKFVLEEDYIEVIND